MSRMNFRNIRGPNCWEASVRTTMVTEKTTPATVMTAAAIALRTLGRRRASPLDPRGQGDMPVVGGAVEAVGDGEEEDRRQHHEGRRQPQIRSQGFAAPGGQPTVEQRSVHVPPDECRPGFPALRDESLRRSLATSDYAASTSALIRSRVACMPLRLVGPGPPEDRPVEPQPQEWAKANDSVTSVPSPKARAVAPHVERVIRRSDAEGEAAPGGALEHRARVQ